MNDLDTELVRFDEHPFFASTYEGRPITRRWGPSLLHIDEFVGHIQWAMLTDRDKQTKWRTLLWGDESGFVYGRSIASVQTDKSGVFVGRHPTGVSFVLIEDWTHLDDVTGTTWA